MIYLDNCSTTRVDDDVAALVLSCMKEDFGNPSSLHHFGMDAYQIVGNARAQIASMIGAPTDAVHFCSSGSDANRTALLGTAYTFKEKGRTIVTTAIEHSSVLKPLRNLEEEGFKVRYVMPDQKERRMKAEDILDAVDEDTILLSMMHANNETGEILPVQEVIEGVRKKNPHTLIHIDCVQSFGKIPVELYKMKADMLTASGHKIHAPKGIGFLYIRSGLVLKSPFFFGAQEKGYHPGTENVPAIAGFGLATEKAMNSMWKTLPYIQSLNDHLRRRLKEIPGLLIHSSEDAIPYVLNISLPGHDSHDMINELGKADIYVSAGAACNKNERSHVLKALGYSEEEVNSALRISFSYHNTIEELDIFTDALRTIAQGDRT